MFRRGLPVNPRLLGIVVIAASMAAISFAFVSHKGLPGRDYTYAKLAFEQVPPGLRPGSDVRVRGQRVGQVHGVHFDSSPGSGGPQLEIQLSGGFELYKDATARIRSRSLLGQKYVQIEPGHPRRRQARRRRPRQGPHHDAWSTSSTSSTHSTTRPGGRCTPPCSRRGRAPPATAPTSTTSSPPPPTCWPTST